MTILEFEQSLMIDVKNSIKLKYPTPESVALLAIFVIFIFNINSSNPQVLEKKVKMIYVTRNPRDAVV